MFNRNRSSTGYNDLRILETFEHLGKIRHVHERIGVHERNKFIALAQLERPNSTLDSQSLTNVWIVAEYIHPKRRTDGTRRIT